MTPTADTDEARSTLLARAAAGVSIAVHVVAVVLSLGYAGAGLFASDPEAVPIEIVSAQDSAIPPPPEMKDDERPDDQNRLDLRPTLESSQSPAQKPQAQSRSEPGKQAAPTPPAKASSAASPRPAYTPPQPDISLRYQIDLGLKPPPTATTPQTEAARSGTSDFDDAATSQAQIERASIATFRARLKQCAPLPANVAPDDKVVIVLRATLTPDAKLAAIPVLIEASASAKGPALMQAAVTALESCQPFNDLPANDYNEWRVLDLRFTPQDFRQG